MIAVDFIGTLQSDGYSAYLAFAEKRGGKIALAGCWAHVPRKFYEALDKPRAGRAGSCDKSSTFIGSKPA